MKNIAVVDDDPKFLETICACLKEAGYAPRSYPSAGVFLDSLLKDTPDLVILDLQLLGVSGWELIRLLKDMPETGSVPVIAISQEEKKPEHVVRALGLGAEEFFEKPLQNDILLAQVEAIFRRGPSRQDPELDSEERLRIGEIVVDIAEHSVHVQGKFVHLTPLEFDLLVHLMRNRNRVLTRRLLLKEVWNTEPTQSTRTVEKRVELVRKKLGPCGKIIKTISGVGYCIRTT